MSSEHENFDFVTIDTYSADMAELSQAAAAIGQQQRQKIADLERLVWCLTKAAGGRVAIPYGVRLDYHASRSELIVEKFDCDMSVVVTAETKLK